MKKLNEYIKESLLDDEDILMGSIKDDMMGQTIYDKLIEHEKLTKDELNWTEEKVSIFKVDREQLRNLISNLKINNISLNWLDVSDITIMTDIFYGSNFNGDISKWDVSKVKFMGGMFSHSEFTGDISGWDVSNVEHMNYMFYYSQFNGNISKWDVSSVKGMNNMFAYSEFNSDISKWDVSNVYSMMRMFEKSKFNKDISKWDVSKVKYKTNIFLNCPIKEKYKPKFK